MGEVQFLPAAREEFLFAAQYYEAEHSGLGEAFIEEVERAAVRITAFPEHGSPHLAGTRRIVLSRFPYSVVYRAEGVFSLLSQWRIIAGGRGTGAIGSWAASTDRGA